MKNDKKNCDKLCESPGPSDDLMFLKLIVGNVKGNICFTPFTRYYAFSVVVLKQLKNIEIVQ